MLDEWSKFCRILSQLTQCSPLAVAARQVAAVETLATLSIVSSVLSRNASGHVTATALFGNLGLRQTFGRMSYFLQCRFSGLSCCSFSAHESTQISTLFQKVRLTTATQHEVNYPTFSTVLTFYFSVTPSPSLAASKILLISTSYKQNIKTLRTSHSSRR